ncbi:MAG: hypothetical protein K8S62_14895 [Candidatus Sabulitectum sp.]|nr:hypothetical protein [Candidatus Sabulitectum sp.]
MPDSESAEETLRLVLEKQPKNSQAWARLLILQLDQEADTSKILKTASLFIEASKHSPESLNLVAKVFYMKGNNKWLSHAKSLALEALEKEPDKWLFAHTLVSILGAEGEWTEALEIAKPFLQNKQAIEDNLNETIEFYIEVAAAGHAVKVLEVLQGTEAYEVLESLVVGLRLLGEKVQVAKEIFEVGKDVKNEIRSRQS